MYIVSARQNIEISVNFTIFKGDIISKGLNSLEFELRSYNLVQIDTLFVFTKVF